MFKTGVIAFAIGFLILGIPCSGQILEEVFEGIPSSGLSNDSSEREYPNVSDRVITTFPYNEGFESTTFPPDGWLVVNNDEDNDTWIRSTSSPYSGVASARILTYGNVSNDDWLITPPLVLTENLRISFWAKSHSVWYPDELQVMLSTTDSELSSFSTVLMPSTLITSTEYRKYGLDLSAYIDTVYIAFVRNQPPTDGYFLYVDDIVVDEYPTNPPGCTTLISPADEETEVEAPDGILEWTQNIDASGYYLYFGTDGEGIIPPTNVENGTEPINAMTYSYEGIEYSTTYYWQVIPFNSYGEAEGCPIWSFTTKPDPIPNWDWGEGGGYFFANSLATDAPSHPVYDWIDISKTGTHVDVFSPNSGADGTDDVLGGDDWVGPISFGFHFPFMDTVFTDFCICSDGKIFFGDLEGIDETTYADSMGTGATIRPAIYWMGRDLEPHYGESDRDVCYGPSDGGLVVTFWHYPAFPGNAGNYITAQVIFYPDGNIKIQYNEDELGPSFSTTASHVVGIVDDTGSRFIEYRRFSNGTAISEGPLFGSNLAVMFGPDQGNLPVELTEFNGAGGDGYAVLHWETATEMENLGYFLLRKAIGMNEYVRVNEEIIPGAGTTCTPHVYEYRDEPIGGGRYYYKLVDVSLDGVTHEHGPVTVSVGEELTRDYSMEAIHGSQVEFRLALPVQCTVRLNVYDMAGHMIWSLNEEMKAGNHSVIWPGSSDHGSRVASGVYVYRMQCGESFVKTGKAILLR